MLQKTKAWIAGAGAGAALALLLPLGASAVTLSSTQHFILGQNPYLHDGPDAAGPGAFAGDGTTPMPGVNVPDVPIVDMGTWVGMDPEDNASCMAEPDPEFCMPQWMRVMSTDYEVTLDGDGLPTPGGTSPTNAALITTDWTITLDNNFDVAENAMVTEDGKLKLLFVIWGVREGDDVASAIDGKTIVGGFDKDGFSGELMGGPVIADASHAEAPIPFPDILSGDPNSGDPVGSPGTHFDHGLGLRIALDPGQQIAFSADYFAGENLGAGTDLFVFWDLYWYKVPEPGTALMLLMGLAGVAYLGRRTH